MHCIVGLVSVSSVTAPTIPGLGGRRALPPAIHTEHPMARRAAHSSGGPSPLLTPDHLKLISTDELWALHVEISAVLARRISAEKRQLEQRLQALRAMGVSKDSPPERRPYPQVFPKYRNPTKPSETWAGRGKQPRWLTAQFRSGKKLYDFLIRPLSGGARHKTRP